jgi:hypothetical protein
VVGSPKDNARQDGQAATGSVRTLLGFPAKTPSPASASLVVKAGKKPILRFEEKRQRRPRSVRTLLGFPAKTPSPASASLVVKAEKKPILRFEEKKQRRPRSVRKLLGFPDRAPSHPPTRRGEYGRRPYLQVHEDRSKGLASAFTRKKDNTARYGLRRPLTQVALLSAAVVPFGGVLMLIAGPGVDPVAEASTTAPRKELVASQATTEQPTKMPSWTLGRTALPVDPVQDAAEAPAKSAAPAPDVKGTTGPAPAAPQNRTAATPVNAVSAGAAGGSPPAPAGAPMSSSEDPVAAVLSGAEKVVTMVSKELEGTARRLTDPTSLIFYIWGPEGPRALLVAVCESNLRTWAQSPHGYEGIFQLGPFERAQYGAGDDARSQIEAAHRLFRVRGWEPWPICAQGFISG